MSLRRPTVAALLATVVFATCSGTGTTLLASGTAHAAETGIAGGNEPMTKADADAGAEEPGTAPARRALVRLLGEERAAQVELAALPEEGGARYTVGVEDGRLRVAGTDPATILAGFGTYLREVAHADASVNGDNLDLPRTLPLPLPTKPISRDADVKHRFALNDTNEGYAGAYTTWKEWQHQIDVLALDGYNEVLVYEGQEAVYQQTMREFGYTDAEMRGWIPFPGHQPWWLMQNMSNSTKKPLSQKLIDSRVRLGSQITGRLRELGMTPVLPGYYGTVPDHFSDRNPGAHTVPQGTWSSAQKRPDWLDPTGTHFAEVARTFYEVQERLFGKSTMFKMDLLHEGGKPGDVNVGDAARGVQRALEKAHPGATWAILGWWGNPRADVLAAIDRSRALILDGNSDQPDVTDREKDFQGTPYTFGTIWNFGGHTGLGVAVKEWNRKFHQMRDKEGSKLDGIALMPEAVDNNPAAVEFFADLAWEDKPVDFTGWFRDYATARYGGTDAHAQKAWELLAASVYSWPPDNDTKYAVGLVERQPGLSTSMSIPYDPAALEKALGELLAVSPERRRSTAYRHDLVDLARQVLANRGQQLLPRIRAAYQGKDLDTFRKHTAEWTRQLSLMDELLGTDRNFLFGAWQQDASTWASDASENRTLQDDIRQLVTIWDRTSPIQDYASREWNGLVGDYYLPRWQRYFATLEESLHTGREPAAVDWKKVAADWSLKTTRYRSTPAGDAHALAAEVAQAPAGKLELSPLAGGVAPGKTLRVTATFTNDNAVRATAHTSVELTAPEGWTVSPAGPGLPGSVPAGGSASARFDVTAPASAKAASTPGLKADVRWRSGDRAATESAAATALVTGPLSEGLKAAKTTEVGFAQDGEKFAMAGGGSDTWTDVDEFGAVYRENAVTDGNAVTTKVTSQVNNAPYARAGLVLRSDLSTPGSAGYATLALTPEHGCLLSYDSDGDGHLDTNVESGGFTNGTHLRLGRVGDRVVASCSSDGKNWVQVGAPQVPGLTAELDAGLFYSAVNHRTKRDGLATFQGLGTTEAELPAPGEGENVSTGRPATALSSEDGSPPSAAVDGDRTNGRYWASRIATLGTWWQVDLGSVKDLTSVNVRNYVDGKRAYTYRLEGSTDGEHWFALGGRSQGRAATDAGDTFTVGASARHVRVTGLANTANPSFHLSEVTVLARD
ncbi:alpha-N-acetylglucosaminidase C-terminal domain-containing protein [Streptomyces sp. NA04227]|uniref:alpha-N-acetylglucosaminidase TIM-barrel domain-containing protein n=1 Tax=Streptomyces sp. NA04227 TaxID=2742136 RepID=UPI0015917D3F|nr:alpha-N-acetylglucosaminidase TIM-barrel domain-containing protein [Streptomyces sp. NA04227]QKW07534.1 alpha-N-acetylglucosaminidase C-terminal domain-containing protein [Streptomyces sp. NA04227]